MKPLVGLARDSFSPHCGKSLSQRSTPRCQNTSTSSHPHNADPLGITRFLPKNPAGVMKSMHGDLVSSDPNGMRGVSSASASSSSVPVSLKPGVPSLIESFVSVREHFDKIFFMFIHNSRPDLLGLDSEPNQKVSKRIPYAGSIGTLLQFVDPLVRKCAPTICHFHKVSAPKKFNDEGQQQQALILIAGGDPIEFSLSEANRRDQGAPKKVVKLNRSKHGGQRLILLSVRAKVSTVQNVGHTRMARVIE